MARRTFFDIISANGFNADKEYLILEYLFAIENSVGIGGYLKPLCTYVDLTYFRKLPIRGTYTNIEDVISLLEQVEYSSPLERLFVFCEFLIAVLPEKYTKQDSRAYTQACTIMKNITAILDQTNHELRTLGDSRVIIAEKNVYATQAVELVEDESVSLALLEYNHFALKGDLEGKREILVNVGRYLEPILLSRKLENAGYKQLSSDMGFLLNHFHIRHNNKDGKKAQEYIQQVSAAELEEWYDKTYNTALAVIIVNTQIDICADLDTIKQTYIWKS